MSSDSQSYIPPSSAGSDMRYFPRWEVKSRAAYYLEEENGPYEGQTKDISCAGACISGPQEVLPHQKIKVVIDLTEDIQITLKAHVLWVKTENDNPVMGVTFYDTPDDIQNLILKHAFELDRDKFVNHLFQGWNKIKANE